MQLTDNDCLELNSALTIKLLQKPEPLLKRKQKKKHPNAPILRCKKRWIENNINFLKTTTFSFIN